MSVPYRSTTNIFSDPNMVLCALANTILWCLSVSQTRINQDADSSIQLWWRRAKKKHHKTHIEHSRDYCRLICAYGNRFGYIRLLLLLLLFCCGSQCMYFFWLAVFVVDVICCIHIKRFAITVRVVLFVGFALSIPLSLCSSG